MHCNFYEMPLDEICARTIAEARGFADDLPAAEIACDALEHGSIRRGLDRIRSDGGIAAHADGGLYALQGILERELENETLRWISEFRGHVDPELGPVGEVCDVRILSERGELVDAQIRRLASLDHMRGVCCARLDAEHVMRRMAG